MHGVWLCQELDSALSRSQADQRILRLHPIFVRSFHSTALTGTNRTARLLLSELHQAILIHHGGDSGLHFASEVLELSSQNFETNTTFEDSAIFSPIKIPTFNLGFVGFGLGT